MRRVPALVAASASLPHPPTVASLIAIALLAGACSAVVSSPPAAPHTSPVPPGAPGTTHVPSEGLGTSPPRTGAADGWIAVAADRMEEGDIYLVGAGVPPRRIVGVLGDRVAQGCPAFSPDGGRLAYGEGRPDLQPGEDPLRGRASVADRAVVVVALDGHGDPSSQITRIPASAAPGPVPCPRWSPDGRSVAFRVGTRLWVSDAGSGTSTAFEVADAAWGEGGLAWSRDGSRIAVAEPARIRIVAVDGGASTVIPISGATPTSLGWAAGDDRIVYRATDSQGDGLDLRVVDIGSQADTRLTPGPTAPRAALDPVVGSVASTTRAVDAAAVSPDGSRVALAYHDSRCTSDGCAGDPEHLLTIDPSGADAVEVQIPTGFGITGLVWSPDGRRLLLGSSAGLVSVPVAAGSPTTVYSTAGLDLEWSGAEVTWQPTFP